MKKRSAEAKKNSQGDPGGSSTSTDLDESLWGTLQHHIDLAENVYSKLPFEEFFQLRIVCKDWYAIACKRLGLKDPIHKPFFTLFRSRNGRLTGILTYKALSRSWECRSSGVHNYAFNCIASKGVAFSVASGPLRNLTRLYHWQSRKLHRLAPPPIPPSFLTKTTPPGLVLGVIGSEEQGLLSSFRVVCGSQDFDTQVYESGVWQTKPCRLPKRERGGSLHMCVDCNGRVYITTEHSREILVYDFEKARWSSLLSPDACVSKLDLHYRCCNTLGAWSSRIFDVTCDCVPRGRIKSRSLEVWELVDETLSKWEVYDCMPKGLWLWLRSPEGFLRSFNDSVGPMPEEINIDASFCGDFMLVYSWDYFTGLSGRFCLFNMATKNWEKLNLAAGAVTIKFRNPELYT